MRSTVIIVCLSLSTLLASWEAQALDVNQACNGDFNRYCSRYDAYSTSGKACMRSMGRSHRLDRDCLRALEEGGYVTQADRAHARFDDYASTDEADPGDDALDDPAGCCKVIGSRFRIQIYRSRARRAPRGRRPRSRRQ